MSSTTNTLAKKYSAASFFRFNFRQNIQHLALYLVITVLVMVLPTIMMIENYYSSIEYSQGGREYLIEEAVQNVALIGLFVSGGIALLSGLGSLSFVNSKQNIGCYHSFPIKREVMYLTESLTRAIYYVITMLVGYTLPYFILLIAMPSGKVIEYSGDYMKLILAGVIAFVLIYSAFLLAAGLTGTAFMRFVMLAVIFFLPVAIYAVFVVSFLMANSDIYDSYYWNEEIIQYICTPVRAVIGVTEMIEYSEYMKLLMLIPEAAVYYIGGMLLHKYRKTESTGTTIIWKPVFAVLKYIIIVITSFLGAYIFYNGFEETWLSFFIGAVIGAVLSLIIMNCLLYRSSRAMFKGLRAFALCCVVSLVFMIFVPLNVTGKVGEFYSAGNTKEITVEISNTGFELTFDEKDDIDAIMALLSSSELMYSGDEYLEMPVLDPENNAEYYKLDNERTLAVYIEKYGYTAEDIENIKKSVGKSRYGIETFNMKIVQKPKFGLPLAVRVSTDANSMFSDVIFTSDEFAEKMNISEWVDRDSLEGIDIHLDNRSLGFYEFSECIYSEDNLSTHYAFDGAWNAALEILDHCNYNTLNGRSSAVLGHVTVYTSDDVVNYPISADNLELINRVCEIMSAAHSDYLRTENTWQPYSSSLEYFRDAEELIDDNSLILLVDTATGDAVEITDEEFAELGQYTAAYFNNDTWSIRYMLRYSESRYVLLYQRDNERDVEMRFRKDAITDEELSEYFAD